MESTLLSRDSEQGFVSEKRMDIVDCKDNTSPGIAELSEHLCRLTESLWNLQEQNYNIEDNYPEFLSEINLTGSTDDEIIKSLNGLNDECQKVLSTQKPQGCPVVYDVFTDKIAPIPNNPATSALINAIFKGGKEAQKLTCGWKTRGQNVVYETINSKGGKIIITPSAEGTGLTMSLEDQWKFVESLSPLTADVAMWSLAHICKTFNQQKTNNPIYQETVVSAEQFLQSKNIKLYGARRWHLKEVVGEELNKIGSLQIAIKSFIYPGEKQTNFKDLRTNLIKIQTMYRTFNKQNSRYLEIAWKLRPGEWANNWLSTAENGFKFIGKLHQDVFQLDHRSQRGPDVLAKKIMYIFFTVPGGTYNIKLGVKKDIIRYFEMIGEKIHIADQDRKIIGRKIDTLYKALQKLHDIGIISQIEIDPKIKWRQPHCMKKILSLPLKIKLESPLCITKQPQA